SHARAVRDRQRGGVLVHRAHRRDVRGCSVGGLVMASHRSLTLASSLRNQPHFTGFFGDLRAASSAAALAACFSAPALWRLACLGSLASWDSFLAFGLSLAWA